MLAEGRISRFLAIFQDPAKIERLASVRSARPYFIDIAQSYGAVYLHFGGSVPAYDAIAARDDLISIDGIQWPWEGTLFFRDPDRRAELGLEHSVFTTGEYITTSLPELDESLAQEGTTPSAFNFSSVHSALDGSPATRVEYVYSSSNTPYFTYDETSGNYLRFQHGEAHMDAWLDQQISVKNLLVLRMQTADVPNSSLKLIEITTTGSGDGYYFCDGKSVPITWEKEAYNAPILFYDAAGEPLVLARGQSFVSCITTTTELTINE